MQFMQRILEKYFVKQYKLPTIDLLIDGTNKKLSVSAQHKRTAKKLESTFSKYGIHGRIMNLKPGPLVTLYEFLPNHGMRMNDILATIPDMIHEMGTENIHIGHIPNTMYVGVEIVNRNRQMIWSRPLIQNPEFTHSEYHIPLALGVTQNNEKIYCDLQKISHLLIAGRCGSGKTLFIQSIITSILYHFTPDRCKLMIINSKGNDFTLWNGIPHLIRPIIATDKSESINALKWLVAQMTERINKLRKSGVKTIDEYNKLVAKSDVIPYIVIMIDEFADLMPDAEQYLVQLVRNSRLVGIHLIISTKHMNKSVLTDEIKAYFQTRIAFKTKTTTESCMILDENGAESLLPYGDMLFSDCGRIPVRVHSLYISDSELVAIANFIRSQKYCEYKYI